MPKTSNKQILQNILLMSLTLLACFAFAEFLLKKVLPNPEKNANSYGYPNGLFVADDTKGYRYKENFVGFFPGKKYQDIEIKINSKGLRDYEYDYDKASTTTRILGLGDSVTFGSGVKFEDTYLRQLEKKYQENNIAVEIIKAGVNGYEFDQQHTYFFEEGYKYEPDIIMMGVVLNDAEIIDIEKRRQRYVKTDQEENNSPYYCALCTMINNVINKLDPKEKNYNQIYFELVHNLWKGEAWENYQSKLLEINDYAKENDAKIVLVIYPYAEQFENHLGYDNEPQNKITKLAEENDIVSIDLLEYLDTANYADYFLENDNLHLNAKGYALVKDIIFTELSNTNIITNNEKE